jgi:hypothetical protein
VPFEAKDAILTQGQKSRRVISARPTRRRQGTLRHHRTNLQHQMRNRLHEKAIQRRVILAGRFSRGRQHCICGVAHRTRPANPSEDHQSAGPLAVSRVWKLRCAFFGKSRWHGNCVRQREKGRRNRYRAGRHKKIAGRVPSQRRQMRAAVIRSTTERVQYRPSAVFGTT